MRHWNRLALGALAAAIVAIAAGAGAYAMRGSDEPSVLHQSEQGTPQADASRQPAPGGGPASSAMCAPEHPDCGDTIVQPDAELTCEEAGACADPAAADCPPGAVCGAGARACAPGAACGEPAQMYECVEPQADASMPCASPCDIGGGPAENVRCFPPEPCGPAPEPGGGGGGVMPMEPGVDGIAPGEPRPGGGGGTTPVEPPSGEPPADAPTPCAPPSLPPDCAISSDGAITCPDMPPDDSGPGQSEPGSPGVAPPPVVVTAVAQ